ncbi:MAG: hypothetical protein Q7R43_05020 [Candidatus Daviesbacteria bacterium]|nr:hypothetical protein [Candidatus Daviesbacteria bacterium]
MKEIKTSRSKVIFEGQGGETVIVSKKDPHKRRQRYALSLGAGFVINHSEEVLSLMGADTSEEMDVFKNQAFQQMVKALEYARVSRRDFMKEMTEVVSASTHSPADIQVGLIADSFTSYVYGEMERLGLERRARA